MSAFGSGENWRAVPGYTCYEVSNMGRVRRSSPGKNTHVGRVLKGTVNGSGYVVVALCEPVGESTIHSVHRLVCEAFHGPPEDGTQVDHINANKADNRACNLRWVTPTENERHKMALGRKALGEDHPNAKLSTEDVRKIRRLAKAGRTLRELARRFGVSRTMVHGIVRRKHWRHVS